MTISNEEVRQNLAANLARILAQRHLSQADLARLSGESEHNISRAVRGLHVPGGGSLARIAHALDASVDRLLAPPSEPALSGQD